MVKIRRANCLDKFRLKKLISFLSDDAISHYTKVFLHCPLNFLHALLPLRLKFLPESFVLEKNKKLVAMATITPTSGNPFKFVINRLFLEQNSASSGKQIIDYVVNQYGAKGARAFLATIEDTYNELLHLFIDGCGFRQCSCEQLWKMNSINFTKAENTFFRPFKNSDALAVAMLFNDSIITHFKYSISRNKDEYKEPFFKGLKDDSKFKFVIENGDLKTINSYFSITTNDNYNYILDITSSGWHECPLEDIFEFSINQISKRKKNFQLFAKVKKYTTTAEKLEEFLKSKNFECVQSQHILVKDFYKQIKETSPIAKVVLFSDVNEKPVFKVN